MRFILCTLLFLTSCAPGPVGALPSVVSLQYRISAGDKVNIRVPGENSLTGEYTVIEDGRIIMPMVGEVYVVNKTLSELRNDISFILQKKYIKNAVVNIDLLEVKPIYILGEVQNPGSYSYKYGMSVYAIVAEAGGFTYRANKGNVYVRHFGEKDELLYKLSPGSAVFPGDTIRISTRYF